MASKGIYTYATRNDFAFGLQALEAKQPLFYILDNIKDSPDFPVYRSYEEIPDLGKAFTGKWVNEKKYRVLTSAEDLEIVSFELLWDGRDQIQNGPAHDRALSHLEPRWCHGKQESCDTRGDFNDQRRP